jgi:hypothetical protein
VYNYIAPKIKKYPNPLMNIGLESVERISLAFARAVPHRGDLFVKGQPEIDLFWAKSSYDQMIPSGGDGVPAIGVPSHLIWHAPSSSAGIQHSRNRV